MTKIYSKNLYFDYNFNYIQIEKFYQCMHLLKTKYCTETSPNIKLTILNFSVDVLTWAT